MVFKDMDFISDITSSLTGEKFAFVTEGKKKDVTVPIEKLTEFFKDYCDGICNGEEVDIQEASKDMMPLIISFKLHFDSIVKYDENCFIDNFISIVTDYITSVAEGVEEDKTSAIVLTSDVLHSANETEISYRFQFPYFVTSREFIISTILPSISRELRLHNIKSMFKAEPRGDWDSIIDKSLSYVDMYGSGKLPLKLKKYVGNASYEVEHHSWVRNKTIDVDELREHRDFSDTEYWLPVILSPNYCMKYINCKSDVTKFSDDTERSSSSSIVSKVMGDSGVMQDETEPISILKRLLPLLGTHRKSELIYWKDVGSAMRSIFTSEREGLKKFTEWSSGFYSKYDCKNHWWSINKSYITIKTIALYAKQDSPQAYNTWHREWCKIKLNEALQNTSNLAIAEILYRLYFLDFIYVNEHKQWYKFNGTYLVKGGGELEIKKEIVSKVIRSYREMMEELPKDDVKLKPYTNIITKLGNSNFITACVNSAKCLFYVTDFELIRDLDSSKMAWIKNVTEVSPSECKVYIRSGKLEDYITMNTRQNLRYPNSDEEVDEYEEEPLHDDHPLVLELLDWLGKVFPEPELLHYFLKDSSSFLYRKNSDKLFRIWSGAGNNSKSMLAKLYLAVFGSYCINLPNEVFCGKRIGSGSGPNPEIAQSKGTCCAFVSEVTGNETLQAGPVKKYTGGDELFARSCNQDGGSFEATFKIIMQCNTIPQVSGADKAAIERFLIIPFISYWSDDCPEDPEEQMAQRSFKKDPTFDRRIPALAQAMAYVMVKYYPIYCEEGLNPPQSVIDYTNKYWENNDPYNKFGKQCLRREEGGLGISEQDTYNVFKTWYRESYPGENPPGNNVFYDQMIQPIRLGKPGEDGRWKGWIITKGEEVKKGGPRKLGGDAQRR
jgi:hypothetical protein